MPTSCSSAEHEELVAVLVLHLARETVGGGLGCDGVKPEALGHQVPAGRALEEVEGCGAGGERLDALRGEDLDRLGDAGDLALLALRRAVRDPQHGDHERDVGLHRLDHLTDRGAVLPDHAQDAVARLRQSRKCLERLERSGEPASVAFVVPSRCGIRPAACLMEGEASTVTPGIGRGGRKVETFV